MAPEPAASRSLCFRPCVSGGRRRAFDDPNRRPRHEHGVGDAFDLSWKLAGTLAGWGGPLLLQSYEFERRQIGERNIGASRYAALGYRQWRSRCGPALYEETPAGHAAREDLVAVADVEQRKVNEMIGAELGYRYVDSPIIDNIPGGPEHLYREYRPTTWPGADCRIPGWTVCPYKI